LTRKNPLGFPCGYSGSQNRSAQIAYEHLDDSICEPVLFLKRVIFPNDFPKTPTFSTSWIVVRLNQSIFQDFHFIDLISSHEAKLLLDNVDKISVGGQYAY